MSKDSTKKTLIKTLSWETFHLVGVAGVIYLLVSGNTQALEH
jgi:hypothetical protein